MNAYDWFNDPSVRAAAISGSAVVIAAWLANKIKERISGDNSFFGKDDASSRLARLEGTVSGLDDRVTEMRQEQVRTEERILRRIDQATEVAGRQHSELRETVARMQGRMERS